MQATHSAYQAHKTELVPTGADICGPYYKAGAPLLQSGVLALPAEPDDEAMILTGKVLGTDGQPMNVPYVLDVWQADTHGNYDLNGYNLRGKFAVEALTGRYRIETIRPGHYQISDPGVLPVEYRCAHLHVRIWDGERLLLTTQLYFSDDPLDAQDSWFDERRCLSNADGMWKFDFVLAKG